MDVDPPVRVTVSVDKAYLILVPDNMYPASESYRDRCQKIIRDVVTIAKATHAQDEEWKDIPTADASIVVCEAKEVARSNPDGMWIAAVARDVAVGRDTVSFTVFAHGWRVDAWSDGVLRLEDTIAARVEGYRQWLRWEEESRQDQALQEQISPEQNLLENMERLTNGDTTELLRMWRASKV